MNKQHKNLSIIIPVYNVEAYIEKCVLSIQQQDIPSSEYEIIIVNDGSPDNSRQIILDLLKQYDNIVFIDQENKGVSLARNAGIDRAIGKYLLFIDPDDFVEQNCFARVFNAAKNQNAQVAFLGFTFLNEDTTVRRRCFFSENKNKLYSGVEAYFKSRGNETIDPDRTWAILFETEFVNKFGFRYIPDVPYLEDGEFIARILCMAERCIFEGGSFYNRTTRPGSATNSKLFYSDKSINGFIKAAANLKQFSQNQQLSEAQRIFLNHPLAKFIFLTVESSARLSTWRKIFLVRKKLIENNLGRLSLLGVVYPYNIYAKMYNVSPFLFIFYLLCKKMILSFTLKMNHLLPLKRNSKSLHLEAI